MNELRDRIIAYLLKDRVGIISTTGSAGAWAMPVWYCPVASGAGSRVLDVDCLLPRWADVVYHLEQNPRALLIVLEGGAGGLRWLQCQGTAQPVNSPDWSRLLPEGKATVRPEDRYVAVRITPDRIDLIDESLGWGARETLDL